MSDIVEEIEQAARLLGVSVRRLEDEHGRRCVACAFERLRPRKKTGHLCVSGGELPTTFEVGAETNEFHFTPRLSRAAEPAIVFFEQRPGRGASNPVMLFARLAAISAVMEACSGMEYFIGNETGDFLVSVNWYVICGIGDITLAPGDGS